MPLDAFTSSQWRSIRQTAWPSQRRECRGSRNKAGVSTLAVTLATPAQVSTHVGLEVITMLDVIKLVGRSQDMLP
jgi:hypothetical protein